MNNQIIFLGKPSPVRISISNIKARFITLEVGHPIDTGNSTLKALVLSLKKVKGDVEKVLLNLNTTSHEIESLTPYTKYELNVTVENEIFESIGQKAIFRTKEAGKTYFCCLYYLALFINNCFCLMNYCI